MIVQKDILTVRQEAILGFIRSYTAEQGYPPTLREIGQQFGIKSTNGVNDHLIALEKKGALTRSGMKSRALRPTGESNHGWLDVPLVGRVAAGTPVLATENITETFRIGPELLGSRTNGEIFALRVQGDSMIEAGIFDGDLLFVRQQETATSGQIVVAMLGEEATVKRYHNHGGQVRLVPENPTMEPMVIGEDRLQSLRILGVAVGVYKKV